MSKIEILEIITKVFIYLTIFLFIFFCVKCLFLYTQNKIINMKQDIQEDIQESAKTLKNNIEEAFGNLDL